MSDCGGYDNTMAVTLAQGVIQAYNYYAAWNNDDPYQITLGQYRIMDIISVYEASSFEDVPFGFTAYGSFSGSPPYNSLVILRGTQTGDEAFYDMDWSPTPFVLQNGKQYGQAGDGVYDFYTGTDEGAVNSLEHNIMVAVQKLAKQENYPTWYFAGHSLGGALITMAAMDAVVSGWYGTQANPTTTLYTYGSLHVGDQVFATDFASSVPNAYRIANLADWVPSLVGLEADTPGYVHVGLPVTFLWQKDGDWANHSMQDTYLRTLQNFASVLKCGTRLYPE